jgi:hypothetical protein
MLIQHLKKPQKGHFFGETFPERIKDSNHRLKTGHHLKIGAASSKQKAGNILELTWLILVKNPKNNFRKRPF